MLAYLHCHTLQPPRLVVCCCVGSRTGGVEESWRSAWVGRGGVEVAKERKGKKEVKEAFAPGFGEGVVSGVVGKGE